jgi:hypothetical protein
MCPTEMAIYFLTNSTVLYLMIMQRQTVLRNSKSNSFIGYCGFAGNLYKKIVYK